MSSCPIGVDARTKSLDIETFIELIDRLIDRSIDRLVDY